MRLQPLAALLPCFVVVFGASIPNPHTPDSRFPSILDAETDAFINRILADWKSPGGVSVAFVRKNDEGEWVNVEAKGYGRANVQGDKVTEKTTFEIGSNSKVSLCNL
jgi:CubicO group peptidase (beta-lactamase class C family)